MCQFSHHQDPRIGEVVLPFAQLAHKIAHTQEGPEASVCIRKLLEASDCAQRCEREKIEREKIN